MGRVGRREFLFVAGAILAAASAALAQQQDKVWRIGVLLTGSSVDQGRLNHFKRGMVELGYKEGQNVVYEARFAEDRYERLPALAVDLVRLNVDLILASPTPAIRAAQQATKTIPIVMATGVDPVRTGLVQSLAHPGGNITGLSNLGGEFVPKLLELLHSTIPRLARVAVLSNPSGPATNLMLESLRNAARASSIALLVEEANTLAAVEEVLQKAKQDGAQAVVVIPDGFFQSRRRQISEIATRIRLPIAGLSEFAEVGGLMSYGPPLNEQYRRAATFVDKILRGAKPADLPVEQATQLELVLNLKTAKALGLTIPQLILQRADRVIE